MAKQPIRTDYYIQYTYTRSSSSAVFSHTRHAYTHTYTFQIENSYHSKDHPIFTPGESTSEDRYISEVKPSEDREKVLGRTKCPRSFGQMLPLGPQSECNTSTHTQRLISLDYDLTCLAMSPAERNSPMYYWRHR